MMIQSIDKDADYSRDRIWNAATLFEMHSSQILFTFSSAKNSSGNLRSWKERESGEKKSFFKMLKKLKKKIDA
jgi:hypothetical protein